MIAIILAGGFGTRMSPITDTLSKCLVPINGEPALYKILKQLNSLDCSKIVVLTGYLGQQVKQAIHNFDEFGEKIILIDTPESFSPAQRILSSAEYWKEDEKLLLLYCDNVLETNDLIKHVNSSDEKIRVVLQNRNPGNCITEKDGKTRYFEVKDKRYSQVELGYWLLDSSTFNQELLKHQDLVRALVEISSRNFVVSTLIDNYYSLSNLEVYANQRNQRRKTVFLDRDGVLIQSIEKGKYVKELNQVVLINNNVDFLKAISMKFDVDFIVVTNQAGVEMGLLNMEDVNQINRYLAVELLLLGVPILAFYVCPHHWDSQCKCRKPEPGLIKKAIYDFNLKSADCLLIGDRDSDIEAGNSAGVKSFLLSESLLAEDRQNTLERIESFLSISKG
jgi:D-glycero-D-manno-heptose 1,7-bisphosphate phosphatase